MFRRILGTKTLIFLGCSTKILCLSRNLILDISVFRMEYESRFYFSGYTIFFSQLYHAIMQKRVFVPSLLTEVMLCLASLFVLNN